MVELTPPGGGIGYTFLNVAGMRRVVMLNVFISC